MESDSDRAVAAGGTLTVTCRLFGRYAELLGAETVALVLRAPATAADAVAALRAQLPQASALPPRPLVALNQRHVLQDAPLAAGDELAFLPPLAGG
jgi:molybdopterin converting factor small subunit